MNILTQIRTIVISIIYGYFFSLMININYKYLTKNKLFNIILTFTFIITFVLIYFIIIKKINNAIFSQYEILCIVIGFIIENITPKVEKKRKKWYTINIE